MAVSGSTDAAYTGSDIVTYARSLLGIQAAEETLQAHELTEGLFWLTVMLKAWEADGVMAWVLTEGSFALVQSDVDYVFGSGGTFTTVPIDITQMRITRNSMDLEMERMSREDYYALPNKTTEGYPTTWFYDRQRDSGTLYVWPAPDSGTGTLKFTYRRRIMDMDAGTDNIDLPQEWYLAVVYGLAQLLSPIYGKVGTARGATVEKWASIYYQSVKGFDTAEGLASVRIMPDYDARPR
jgi:hypothetical protein